MPETQTQIVEATQGTVALTKVVATQNDDSFINDEGDEVAIELEKTLDKVTEPEEKSSNKASSIL